MHLSTLLTTVRVALLRSSWRSCFRRAALFITRATNSSLVLLFLCRLRFSSIPTDKNLNQYGLGTPTSNSCISTPTENWTHVYMHLFTRNSPYYNNPKYLLFLLKHPVYTHTHTQNGPRKVARLLFCTCPCDILSGVSMSLVV